MSQKGLEQAAEQEEVEAEIEEVFLDLETASNKKPRLGLKSEGGTWFNFAEEFSDFDKDQMKQKIESHDLRDTTVKIERLVGEEKYVNFEEVSDEDESEESMEEKEKVLFNGDEDSEDSSGSDGNTTPQPSKEKSSSTSGSDSKEPSQPKEKADSIDDYITYAQALEKAHEELHAFNIETKLVHHDRDGKYYLFKATVVIKPEEGRQQVFTGYGDADPNNVNRNIKKHIPRMAETRAKVRALKDAVGLTGVAKAELEDEGGDR